MIQLRNMTSVFITYHGKMLLLCRQGSRLKDVNGTWVGIGGHMEPAELDNPQAAALREVEEEIGIKSEDLENLTLRYITHRLKDQEIRINHYYYAELREGAALPTSCTEGILEWVPIEEVLMRTMPLSAGYMMQHYMNTGRYTDRIYISATREDGVTFAELEKA